VRPGGAREARGPPPRAAIIAPFKDAHRFRSGEEPAGMPALPGAHAIEETNAEAPPPNTEGPLSPPGGMQFRPTPPQRPV